MNIEQMLTKEAADINRNPQQTVKIYYDVLLTTFKAFGER